MTWFWRRKDKFEPIKDLITDCKEEVLDEVSRLKEEVRRLYSLLTYVFKKETNIMAGIKDLAGILQGVKDELDKATTEIVNKIADLENALSNTEIPADAQAVIDGLKADAKALDDIVPDPTPAPAEAPPTEAPPV